MILLGRYYIIYTFITPYDDDDLAGETEEEEEEPGLEPAGATPEYDLTGAGAGAGAEYELAGLPPPIP